MAETKSDRIEREYIIPLREKVRSVPRYKKTNKAIRTIKEFLVRHMKIRDKDLKKVKIDKYLNQAIWQRGIKHPPNKIKVKAIKESGSDEVRAELVNFPDKIKFKKLREERINKNAVETVESKKGLMEKAKETLSSQKQEKSEKSEEKQEEKEREKTSAGATKAIEKEAAKQTKHQTKSMPKEPKHQRRMALQK